MPNNQIKSLTVDGTTYDIVDETSGYIKGMTILTYGSSTWQDFLEAYNSNKVVYCRASSNSNPGTGTLSRLAFMAYVNNVTQPTSVEFQYYRSIATHSATQQGDQVFVYTLTSSNSWSVATREASTKIATSGNLTSNYADGVLTIGGSYLPLSGGTMDSDAYIDISATGGIKFNNAANGAIYSDSGDLVIENAGTGDLYICDLADPSVSTDAANKNYVDTLHGKSIAYKRELTSSDNVNNITDTGVYYIAGSTPTGIASTYAYSYLTVINNGYYIIQELRKPVDGVLAIREKSGDPATWFDWVWTDIVVESGTHTTNGSFKWEKWSNGRARIWGYYSAGSTSLTTSYGNLYFKGSANSFTFPSGLFNAAPLKINLTGYVSTGIVGASCSSISSSSISFFIWSAKSESKSVYVYMDIEGTWK